MGLQTRNVKMTILTKGTHRQIPGLIFLLRKHKGEYTTFGLFANHTQRENAMILYFLLSNHKGEILKSIFLTKGMRRNIVTRIFY